MPPLQGKVASGQSGFRAEWLQGKVVVVIQSFMSPKARPNSETHAEEDHHYKLNMETI